MPTPHDCLREPLKDLGDHRRELAGIWIPASEVGRERVGVTEQFLADADTYHARYTNVPYFRHLLETVFARLELPEAPTVLDLGSGSGNSVFGCLDLLPGAHVVATDISPDLLRILGGEIERRGVERGRVDLVCMSATRDLWTPGAFDVGVGAAILHHLIDPAEAIRALGTALRPGGVAIFFEPFENGNAVLGLAYRDLLERAEAGGALDAHAKGFEVLRAMIQDFAVRRGSDKSAPVYRGIDDKWLFTRSMFEDWAAEAGFRDLAIRPLHDVDRPFTLQTQTNLRLAAGLDESALPEWAWERLAVYDDSFSTELKRDLLIEGSVVMRR